MPRPRQDRLVQATRPRRARPTFESLEDRRLLAIAFSGPTRIPTDGRAQGIALADFDNDGILDLAVAEIDSNRLGISLGRGDGTFVALGTVAAGSGPVDLAAADLDGDGRTDLIVTNYKSNNVSVMLGRGDGTFGPRTHYAVGGGPRSVAVADLDGDGALDLVVGNQGNDVSLLYGRGDGAFASAVGLGLNDQANGVAIADMNGDGRPDILVSGYFQVYIYLNQGPAGFPSRSSHTASGGGGAFVAAGDVNGDGRPDVVHSNTANNFVSVFLNDGRDGLEGPFIYTVGPDPHHPPTADYPFETALVDLDLDGHLDLLMATSRGLVARPGAGDGTFNNVLDFSPRDDASHLAVGDIDGDGKPDVVATDYAAGRVLVFRALPDAPPSVTLAIEDASVHEGDLGATGAVITVRISRPTTVPVSVSYATAGGTATPGVDYTAVSGVLTIPPGSTTATFVVPVAGNFRVDGTRTVGLSLSAPAGPATLGDPASVLTILDDESPSTFRFRDAQVVVDPASGLATVTVERDEARSDGVTVEYATIGGDAVPGVDYAPVRGVLRFALGQTTASFTVPILGDAAGRSGRLIGVVLTDPVGALGAPSAATIVLAAATSPPAPPPPPPPPEPYTTVQSVAVDLRQGGALAAIRVAWSANLDPDTARSLANYRLVRAGRDGRFGTRDDRAVPIRSASYDAAGRAVVLVPRHARLGAEPLRLTVTASVTDARGYAVDGDGDGLPGGDSNTILRRAGIPRDTPGAPAVPGSGRPWKPGRMRRP
ncbi:FG-GAP-like repeat-containing protein [Paludisphaera sp.]|uniref:FG-GAP repeat domain-containing protein n=1 Tax=Paludisphaera sp. TaxID=2017432 RepID=UPI00301DF419